MTSPDFWSSLRSVTQARIGLGRAGDALPTERVIEFAAAHAAARDAVHLPLDIDELSSALIELKVGTPLAVTSLATGRGEYLRRPDLGRLPAGLDSLPDSPGYDVAIILADGLSPRAVGTHGPAMVAALTAELAPDLTIAPPVIATQARVALGDHIADALSATTALVLIGERPGLSVADSLGIYLTHRPQPGRSDAERNCVSNIHPPDGLGYTEAARVVASLIAGARRLGRSGVDLKDSSRDAIETVTATALD
ncbi:ethanolamine ammonia-lyase subunit EutC [Gordonia sp. CPCC 205333]|uniref:ethanolamine ammonia-lyase subunit EutC n=1 Tax=Gordonia sp. CPCC 205333 TaxID=3140790 RepID=UPI003AF3C5BC